jgi:hypothetical protein
VHDAQAVIVSRWTVERRASVPSGPPVDPEIGRYELAEAPWVEL